MIFFYAGAPDIFVVYCGISQDDLGFVLGYEFFFKVKIVLTRNYLPRAMSGGAIFMITVVVGSIILVSKNGTGNISEFLSFFKIFFI